MVLKEICSNQACRKEYLVSDIGSDDGFCSLECWEAVHCSEPVVPSDVFDTTVETLLQV